MPSERTRDQWLTCPDDALLAACEVDTYRASGPGGQKRNKTSSAVRLRHGPSGLMVIAEESRSQHENKARAIRRMRSMIAYSVRLPPVPGATALIGRFRSEAGRIQIPQRHEAYSLVIATILDVVAHHSGAIAEAANHLGVATAQLSRFVTSDSKMLATVNRMRKDAGLRPITGRN